MLVPQWFLSHLLWFGIAGASFFVIGCILWRRKKPGGGSVYPKPGPILIVFGTFTLVSVLFGVIYAVYAPPEPETIPEVPIDKPLVISNTAIERLRLDWNSEGPATWPVAETLALISEISYLPPVDAEKRFVELGFTEFMTVVDASMIGYVVSFEDVTVIVFRGTNFGEISDWITNTGTSAVATPYGKIHSGFHAAYMAMKPQIDQILSEQQATHLWITGHSLGGALGLVCAYDLVQNENRELDGLITFGQPFVARKPLASHIDTLLLGRYARFVNGQDAVPRVPPSYFPCGSLVWFTDKGVRRSKPKVHLNVGVASVQGNDADAVVDFGEIEPLTEAEVEQMVLEYEYQTWIYESYADADFDPQMPYEISNGDYFAYADPEGTLLSGADGDLVYYASSPLFDDHSMTLYLQKVRELLGVAVP